MTLAVHLAPIPQMTSKEVYEALQADPKAVLIDVRMPEEWESVGCPHLEQTQNTLILMPWIRGHHQSFVASLSYALDQAGIEEGQSLYFLCRSGGRSSSAAAAFSELSEKTFTLVNVSDGFEGTHSPYGPGWKNTPLPWHVPHVDFKTAQYPIITN